MRCLVCKEGKNFYFLTRYSKFCSFVIAANFCIYTLVAQNFSPRVMANFTFVVLPHFLEVALPSWSVFMCFSNFFAV